MIGTTRPATNGIRTSTKYKTKVAERDGKVNLAKHPKDAFGVSVFWGLAWIDAGGCLR